MSKKSLLAIASIAGASVLAVGAVFASKISSPFFVHGGGAVDHSLVFGNQDIEDYLEEDGYAIASLSKVTDAGNTFQATDLYVQDYTESGPILGEAGDDYLFLIHHYGWQYGYADPTIAFYVAFEMNVDVASGVTAFVTYTTHYNNAGSQSTSTNNADFDIVTTDDLEYLLEYTYVFDNKYYDYVTIDSITIEYSCTY